MAVKVVNKNSFTYRDKYDSVEYVFPPNTAVIVQDEYALFHFFGYGAPVEIAEKVRLQKMARAGWLKFHDEQGLEQANQIFYNFVFTPVEAKWTDQMAEPAKANTLRLPQKDANAGG